MSGFGQAGFQVLDVHRSEDRIIAVGAAAVKICDRNPNRVRLDLIAAGDNVDILYIDKDSRVTAAAYDDPIPIGETITYGMEDKGEKWAISETAAQQICVREYIQKAGVPSSPILKQPSNVQNI